MSYHRHVTGGARLSGAVELPIVGLGWLAAAAAYLSLRLAVAFHAPVAGVELWSLSGAWAAHVGLDDERCVGTLAQWVATLSFSFTSSPFPARILLATVGAGIAFVALARLRTTLGDGPALTASALFALDPFAVAVGGTASAAALDVPVALLLFSFVAHPPKAAWAWAPLALGVSVAGPLPLTLAFSALALSLVCRRPFTLRAVGYTALGVGVGVMAASLAFGLGRFGFLVPPADLFARTFDAEWSTGSAGMFAALYTWPLVTAAAASAAWLLLRWLRMGEQVPDWIRLALLWCAFSLISLLLAASAPSWLPVLAVTTPAALLVGAAAPKAWDALFRADWRLARIVLPIAGLAFASAALFAFGWAFGRPNGSIALALLAGMAAVAITTTILTSRTSAAAALVVPVAFGIVWLIAMTGRAVAPAAPEPLYSPAATEQGRTIRATVRELAAKEGRIALHPDLEPIIIWPLRDTGTLLVADRPPADVAVYLVPGGYPLPEGFVSVDGRWAFVRETSPPETVRAFLRWMAGRNVHPSRDVPVTIATRVQP